MCIVRKLYIWKRTSVEIEKNMNLLEFFNERNRASSLKSKFETICNSSGFDIVKIGTDSKNNEIFYCKKVLDKKLPNLAILAGFHGDEPAGPYGILNFLKNNLDQKYCNLFLIPLLNPHGFNRHIRRDANRSDMNRQWDDSNKKLINRLKKLFKGQEFDFTLSLHEDDSVDGFYVYGGKMIEKQQLTMIADMLTKYLPPIEDGEIYGDPVFKGVVEANNEDKPKHYKSLEFYFDKIKIPTVTVEISGSLPLEKRIKIYSHFLTKFIKHLI